MSWTAIAFPAFVVLTPGETVLTPMTTLGCLMLFAEPPLAKYGVNWVIIPFVQWKTPKKYAKHELRIKTRIGCTNQNTTLLVMTCNYPILPPYKNLQALFFFRSTSVWNFRSPWSESVRAAVRCPTCPSGSGGQGPPLGRLGTVENTSHTTSIHQQEQFWKPKMSKCDSIALGSIGLPIAYCNNPQFIFGEWLRNPFFGNTLN